MARTKKSKAEEKKEIVHAPARPQPITETIEKNYMPYVMTVILSRAIPEIDGLKPSHRKLLYTMYKMGLLTGNRTKSTNVVGQTMKLNPHGDAAIYETMVRLTRDNETLLHPLVDSKGTFGKQYSSEMPPAASRYTEVKLEEFSIELFRGIDKNAVDMIDNYDGTMKEPRLLPTTYPNVLVMPNSGIAVGMASEICSFNLAEICDGTVALLKKPNLPIEKLMDIIKAPDFSGGGLLLYDADAMREVFETGQGSVRLRARYVYDKANNCIDILQIPYSTSIELIMKKLTEMIKAGKLKEVTDFRDETDLHGFKLTLDLRRGVDPDKLMLKLFHYTPLESNFKCNFNILVDAVPRRLGVKDILTEWIRFRMGCLHRELTYDLGKKKDKLHLLKGLGKILLDIDKAIRIIRKTEDDEKVIPNLMEGFSIDEVQANYIADIKLRNLNRRYILDRISEIEALQKEIEELEGILADELKLKALIAKQLNTIKQKYGKPRKTIIVEPPFDVYDPAKSEAEEAIPTKLVFTQEGYIKKVAIRTAPNAKPEEHRLKEGDRITDIIDANPNDDILFFTDKAQVFRAHVSEFDLLKAAQMGEFVPSKLGMGEGERPLMMHLLHTSLSSKDHVVLIFQNGKGVRIPMSAYETKGFRRKLTAAYSEASPIAGILFEKHNKPLDLLLVGTDNRGILIKSALIPEKTTRTSQGVQLITMKPGALLDRVIAAPAADSKFAGASCRKIKIPSASVELKKGDIPDELK
ncbi:MAG: topoisomerase IV [Clostridia bacterium]|nr:topoisomerase IV [Clostridia bacterium]